MRQARFPVGALLLAALGCAPSTQLESPADPPGIEKEDERSERAESEPEADPELDVEPESESSE
jgi:hypothetical protein